MKFQEFLSNHNIPNHSFLAAMKYVLDQDDLETVEYRVRIIELTGRGDNLNDQQAKYVYLYLIQESVRELLKLKDNDQLNMAIMYNIAETKALNYIKNNPWVFAERDEVKLDSNGKVKKKRGAKKELVCKLWIEHAEENLSRQQWIALLIEKADMTKAGASTYYASLRNGTFGC